MTGQENTAHHGDATVTLEFHHGHLEAVIDIEGQRLVVGDQQNRDLMLCLADLYPSLLPMREPAQVAAYTRAADNGDPNATLPEGVDGYRLCRQCGHKLAQIPQEDPVFCGDECEHNWSVSEYRGWYPR